MTRPSLYGTRHQLVNGSRSVDTVDHQTTRVDMMRTGGREAGHSPSRSMSSLLLSPWDKVSQWNTLPLHHHLLTLPHSLVCILVMDM